ncbi:alkaline phosphatase family protein [Glaciihabitans sp. dw_435]|uniref:alkaline phosphatase family protein n=1 Tax=Glaciihabitans sp. dw_435 TaxID=2720081 RepID=UPI0027DB7306|nr:alkaline phosphatase family protein [Glaciihabitans sp. dw_435]
MLTSSLSALDGSSNRLNLPPVTRAVVLLVDGLGVEALKARSGHARTLFGALTGSSVIDSGFPTTTAAALATLTTGVAPGQHGLVGYTVLDPANDRVVNQLSGWDDRLDPATWQRVPTLFETAVAQGYRAAAVGPLRYRDSGFSGAVLRGAEYLDAGSIAERMQRAAGWLREVGEPGILYVYVPELDVAAHANGWESDVWIRKLEELDSAVRAFLPSLTPTDGLLLTADHGVVDVPHHAHVLIDAEPALLDGVRFVAGDPRCLQLHFEPGLADDARDALIERWRDAEGSRAWVATRAEAIAANWFGEVSPDVAPRIGDLLIAARKNIAYYDGRSRDTHGQAMIGQHGSFSPAEVRVPLLRFGAFARA